MKTIDLSGVEKWREYDFNGRVYRITQPRSVTYQPGGTTHRVVDDIGIVHVVPAPGEEGCVLRFDGTIIA